MKKKSIFKQWWFWSILLVIVIATGLILFIALKDADSDDDDDDTRVSKKEKNPFVGKWYAASDDEIIYFEFNKDGSCELGGNEYDTPCKYEYDDEEITIKFSDADDETIKGNYIIGSSYIKIKDIKFYDSKSKAEKDLQKSDDGDSNAEESSNSSSGSKAKNQMILALNDLVSEKLVIDTGDYIKGDVPAGEYAFIKIEGSGSYYCEKDDAGNIVDNENFDSFGYVKVHAVGNLETDGVLVNVTAFERLGVKGAKELYEILNDKIDWNQSGMYKVGVDIEPGKYVVESIGSGYWSILTGPVSDNDIVDNDNFNGKANINLKSGQYLELSRATITKAQ